MATSVFDLFSIGIGPSSSHTVGPMRAALRFTHSLMKQSLLDATHSVRVDLYGSLGLTGRGHGSDKAVLLGLAGNAPEDVEPEVAAASVAAMRSTKRIPLLDKKEIAFDEDKHLRLHRRKTLPMHPNGMQFSAFNSDGDVLLRSTYYSIGGGFVVDEGSDESNIKADSAHLPYPFQSAAELLEHSRESGLPISGVMLSNELVWRSETEVRNGLLRIWQVMQECVARGIQQYGVLPGGLGVRRRAPEFFAQLSADADSTDPMRGMDWVTLYALAVSEENAAGGRVVTAPTNGAAGIIPAVLHYVIRFVRDDDDAVVRFLLTAGAIGTIYKETASISGAEVGCQGEVGSACSMAAAGLADVLGGSPKQVENAAEIAMEHNLGLTCDPIGGLVQIPCIERNAIAAVKAVAAARTALRGDGRHIVSLDKVVRTMRTTGMDMKAKYKETARGGLAVNVIEC